MSQFRSLFTHRKHRFSDFWFVIFQARFLLCVVVFVFALLTPTLSGRSVAAAALIYLAINLGLGFVSRVTLRRKRIRALPAVLDVGFTSYLVLMTGGENSVWYLLYIFPILSVSRYLGYEGSVFLALFAASTYALSALAGSARVSPPSLILKGLILIGISFVAGNLSRTRKRREDDLADTFRIIDDAIIRNVDIDSILKTIVSKALEFSESAMGQLTVFGEDSVAYSVSLKSDKTLPDWPVEGLTQRYHPDVRRTKQAISVLTIREKRHKTESVEQISASAKAHIYVFGAQVESAKSMPKAALFVPLIVNDEVKGILSLYSKESFHYFDIDALKLESLSPALGIALKHSAEIEKAQRLKLLHTIGEALKVEQGLSRIFDKVVELACAQLSSEEAALFVGDDKQLDEVQIVKVAVKGPTEEITAKLRQLEKPYKPNESLVGKIYKTKQLEHLFEVDRNTLHHDKYSETLPSGSVQHYIGVPIVIGDEVLGVLRVINKRASTYSTETSNFELSQSGFSAEDVELMQTIASQVASAIRSAKFIELNLFYKELIENSPDPIIVLDEKGNITLFNRACEKIWGWSASDVLGEHVTNYYVTPEHAREIGARLKEATNKRLHDYDAKIKDRTGAEIPISLSASLLFDKKRKPIGSIGVFKDLRTTLSLQQEKTNAERLATLGKLAHTVGHEIKHDIATALNYVEVLEFESGGDEDLRNIYREIKESLGEAVDKFQNMLLIGRPRPPQKERIGAADVFQMIESSMRSRAASRSVDLFLTFPDQAKEMDADISQLRQVLLNLLDNSLDAIDTARLSDQERKGRRIECLASAANGNLEIKWRDEGCGIAAARVENIFSPFVTSKPTGNGLGLFIVKNIIDNHAGSVAVTSKEGEGTEFTIVLPLASENESTSGVGRGESH